MRRAVLLLLLLGTAVLAGLVGWGISAPHPRFSGAEAARFEGGDAGRGRLVFLAADCGSCHASPGQPDPRRLGGGMALATPVGAMHPPNISPHPTDGIGRWRGVDLANALMAGVSPNGQHYFPALPYVAYGRMAPGDVADLWAYMRTLPPVPGRAPPHEIPFPLNIRRAIGFWKLLFFHPAPIDAGPARSPAWNRGHYLVEAMAHCGECHSTRNPLGAIPARAAYAGGPDQEGTGFVPNITPAGIGGWAPGALASLLKDGFRPDGRRVAGSMADVVANTAQLPSADREAIEAYVRSLPARPTPRP